MDDILSEDLIWAQTAVRMLEVANRVPGVVHAFLQDGALHLEDSAGAKLQVSPGPLVPQLDKAASEVERIRITQDHLLLAIRSVHEAATLTPDIIRVGVIPVLRPLAFFASMADRPDPIEGTAFLAGLAIGHAVPVQGKLAYASRSMLEEAGLDAASLSDLALGNLRRWAAQVTWMPLSETPWMASAKMDAAIQGSLLLVPEAFAPLAAKHGDLLILHPDQTTLLVVARDEVDPELARQTAQELFAQSPSAVSPELFLWHADAILTLP